MKSILRRNATIGSAILALLLIFVIYTLLGTVDLVFMKGDFQVARIDNARAISDISIDSDDIITGEELEFTYGDDNKIYEADISFRIEIAKTVVLNLLNVVKGEPAVDTIVLTAK